MAAYEPVLTALKEYASDPTPFLYALFLRFLLLAVAGFSALAFLMVLSTLLAYAGLMDRFGLPIMGMAFLVCAVFVGYCWAALKGAMIKSLLNAESGAIHMRDFLRYAFSSGPKFFFIFLVNVFFIVLLNIPIAALILLLHIDPLSLPGILLLLIGLMLALVIRFIFTFSYISAAVKNVSAFTSFRNDVRFLIKNPLPAVALYLLYSLVVISLLIPVLDMFVLVSFYPTLYVLMIDVYKSKGF
ncbi:MAG: hypothetical protein PHS02_02860 [Candidatus ainarchaeum sp.]|nr:hypothetical protein [Candidatus ainarchaeum sp.]